MVWEEQQQPSLKRIWLENCIWFNVLVCENHWAPSIETPDLLVTPPGASKQVVLTPRDM